MTGTGDYTVASSAQLFGSKPPKRREASEAYFDRMAAIDQDHRDAPALARRNLVRTIRFKEPTAASPSSSATNSQAAEYKDDQPFNEAGIAGIAGAAGGGEIGGQARDEASSSANFSDADYVLPSTVYAPRSELLVASFKDARKTPIVVDNTPARAKELTAAATLPAKHTDRIAQTVAQSADVDTSGNQSPRRRQPTITIDSTGLSRSTSKRSRRDSQVTEIYFSPIDVNKSFISLSDPIEAIDNQTEDEESLTPTQESYDERVKAAKGREHNDLSMPTSPRSPRSENPGRGAKIILTPAQIDRLVKALAESPLLNCHVKRQWWDEAPDDDMTVLSDSTPSLSSGSGSGTLYSLENKAFLTEQRSPSTTRAILEEEFAQEYPDHPKAKHPVQHAAASVRTTHFGGIALVDPKVQGTPIRYISEGYRLGANVLQVGACTFLNIPYGTTVQSNLRIEPPSSVNGSARIMLQVVNQVLERKTGKKTFLLVAELDVTEKFTRAAVTELAATAEITLADIQFVTAEEKEREADFDWCALADEFEASCEVTSIVEIAATSFARLSAETCSMQTLTLMSDLERLKTQHQDFLIVRPTGYHKNGMFSGVNIRETSQHLDMMLYESDPDRADSEAAKAARALRDRVVAAVTERCVKGRPFHTRIWWGDQMRLVHCVPLQESGADDHPTLWISFLSGQYNVPFEPFVAID